MYVRFTCTCTSKATCTLCNVIFVTKNPTIHLQNLIDFRKTIFKSLFRLSLKQYPITQGILRMHLRNFKKPYTDGKKVK